MMMMMTTTTMMMMTMTTMMMVLMTTMMVIDCLFGHLEDAEHCSYASVPPAHGSSAVGHA